MAVHRPPAAAEASRVIDKVDHVGVVVRSIDDALPFYLDRLRLAVVGREELPEVGVRVAYLAAGTTMLQLVEPTRPGPLLEHLDAHGDGLHHVCFAVTDIATALPLLAPGADVPFAMGGRGRRACFLPEHPPGVRIELTETEPTAAR